MTVPHQPRHAVLPAFSGSGTLDRRRFLGLTAAAAGGGLALAAGLQPSTASAAASWLSGASGPYAANGSFGSWRGSSVAIGGTWINAANAPSLQPGAEWGSFTGAMDIGVSPPADWTGWYAESTGDHDDYFRDLFGNLAALRAGRGTTYVRPYYEFNGSWFPYKVTPNDITHFKTAWRRMAGIARAEFPQAKLVYCVAASNGADVYACYPGSSYVDVGGIDFYNEWPWVTTQAGFDDKIVNGAGHYSLEDLRYFYEQQGVPVGICEWGNAGEVRPANEGGGGESPQFITSFRNWLSSKAGTGPGDILYEVYFNLYADNFQIYPTNITVQPQTAARYAQLF